MCVFTSYVAIVDESPQSLRCLSMSGADSLAGDMLGVFNLSIKVIEDRFVHAEDMFSRLPTIWHKHLLSTKPEGKRCSKLYEKSFTIKQYL